MKIFKKFKKQALAETKLEIEPFKDIDSGKVGYLDQYKQFIPFTNEDNININTTTVTGGTDNNVLVTVNGVLQESPLKTVKGQTLFGSGEVFTRWTNTINFLDNKSFIDKRFFSYSITNIASSPTAIVSITVNGIPYVLGSLIASNSEVVISSDTIGIIQCNILNRAGVYKIGDEYHIVENTTDFFIALNFIDLVDFIYNAPEKFKINGYIAEDPIAIITITVNGNAYTFGDTINIYDDVIVASNTVTLVKLDCKLID